MRIDSVMGELDLTHLDVVHDHHGNAFSGKPGAMARELVFVGVTALIEDHRKRFDAAAREIKVRGRKYFGSSLENDVLDYVLRVFLAAGDGSRGRPIGPAAIVP